MKKLLYFACILLATMLSAVSCDTAASDNDSGSEVSFTAADLVGTWKTNEKNVDGQKQYAIYVYTENTYTMYIFTIKDDDFEYLSDTENSCHWFLSENDIHDGTSESDKGAYIKNVTFSNVSKTVFSATIGTYNLTFTKIENNDARLSLPTSADFVGTWKTDVTTKTEDHFTVTYQFTHDEHENYYGYFSDTGVCSNDSSKSYSKPRTSWYYNSYYNRLIADSEHYAYILLNTTKNVFIEQHRYKESEGGGVYAEYIFYKQ